PTAISASASNGVSCAASLSSPRIEVSSGVLTLARIRGATPAAKWPRNRAFIRCFPLQPTTKDCRRFSQPRQRVWKPVSPRRGEDAARGTVDRRRYLNLVADGAPKTDISELEASSDALLDELVRALARQIAERDYEALRNKPHSTRRRKGGKKDSA